MTKRHQHLCICSFVLPVLVLSGDDFLWNVLSNQDLPTLPLVTAFLNVHWKYHYATCTAAEPEIHPSASLKVTNEDCTGVRNLWILTVKYRYKYARCCLVCAFYCHRHMWHYSHSRATNLPTYNPGWDRGGMWCDLGCKGWFWAWQRVQVHFCICLIKEQFLKKWFQKRFLGDSVSFLPFTSKMFHALTPFSCTFWSRQCGWRSTGQSSELHPSLWASKSSGHEAPSPARSDWWLGGCPSLKTDSAVCKSRVLKSAFHHLLVP